MAKVSNEVLLTIREELYTHIQTLSFQFFDSRPTGKIAPPGSSGMSIP